MFAKSDTMLCDIANCTIEKPLFKGCGMETVRLGGFACIFGKKDYSGQPELLCNYCISTEPQRKNLDRLRDEVLYKLTLYYFQTFGLPDFRTIPALYPAPAAWFLHSER